MKDLTGLADGLCETRWGWGKEKIERVQPTMSPVFQVGATK